MHFTSCSVLSVLSCLFIYKVGFLQAAYSLSLFIQSDLLCSTGVHIPFSGNVITQVFGLKPPPLRIFFIVVCYVLFLLSFSFPVSYLNYLFQFHFIFLTVLLIYFFHWSPWVYNIRFELIRVYLLLPELYIISFPTLFELLSHTLYFYLHHKHMSYCYSFWLEWVIF